ncbi:MAG TPA: SRPBCC domain-containing protein [Dongiaceae bacterium]|jgi:uncharacterized protein YndB with AHSA1/START domain|nr:SRPBCC domain-containing protein [Dongiaceae bacterium]
MTDTKLIVRRFFEASAERLFRAWTDPERIVTWFGPKGMTCLAAEIDLRVGGHYHLSNRLPNGAPLEIFGEYVHIDPCRELIFSWRTGPSNGPERVTVRFLPAGEGTEVEIIHEHIPDRATRDQHESGWNGSLDRLNEFVAIVSPRAG